MKKLLLIVLSFILLTGAFSGCGEKTDENITFVLDWTPNTNHTGVYAALEKGYFEDEGFKVSIIQPSEGTSDQTVAKGTAQFGISYQENVTFARAAGMPLVSVAAIIQHNTSGFGSIKEKGIEGPDDFEGKIYGGWGGDIEEAMIKYLMEQTGADPAKVEILTTGDMDFFTASTTGMVDFAWMFEGWTLVEAELKGIEMNYFNIADVSEVFDYYTPVVITNEENINNNGEMVKKFMRAVKKGYDYAIENPSEAADILLKHVPELSEDLIRKSQAYLSEKYKDDAPYWGYQKQEVWDRYMEWLYEYGFIDEKIDMTKAYTNDFLQ